jgi:hypothetical protein
MRWKLQKGFIRWHVYYGYDDLWVASFRYEENAQAFIRLMTGHEAI